MFDVDLDSGFPPETSLIYHCDEGPVPTVIDILDEILYFYFIHRKGLYPRQSAYALA